MRRNVSHPTRGAWIEMTKKYLKDEGLLSHPTRGAWIEIKISMFYYVKITVAPHPGCVD